MKTKFLIAGLMFAAALGAGAASRDNFWYAEDTDSTSTIDVNPIAVFEHKGLEGNPSRQVAKIPDYAPAAFFIGSDPFVAPLMVLGNAQDSVIDGEIARLTNELVSSAARELCNPVCPGREMIVERVRQQMGPLQGAWSAEDVVRIFEAVHRRDAAEGSRDFSWSEAIQMDFRAAVTAPEWSQMRVALKKWMATKKTFSIEVDLTDAVRRIRSVFVNDMYRVLKTGYVTVNGRVHASIDVDNQFKVGGLASADVGRDGFSSLTRVYGYREIGLFSLKGDRTYIDVDVVRRYWAPFSGGKFEGNRLPALISFAPHQVGPIMKAGLAKMLVFFEVPPHSLGKKITAARTGTTEGGASVRSVIKGFAFADVNGKPIEAVGLIPPGGDEYLPIVNAFKLAEEYDAVGAQNQAANGGQK